jgi:hypothetical protein
LGIGIGELGLGNTIAIEIAIEIEISSFFNRIDLPAESQEHRCIAFRKDASLGF